MFLYFALQLLLLYSTVLFDTCDKIALCVVC